MGCHVGEDSELWTKTVGEVGVAHEDDVIILEWYCEWIRSSLWRPICTRKVCEVGVFDKPDE